MYFRLHMLCVLLLRVTWLDLLNPCTHACIIIAATVRIRLLSDWTHCVFPFSALLVIVPLLLPPSLPFLHLPFSFCSLTFSRVPGKHGSGASTAAGNNNNNNSNNDESGGKKLSKTEQDTILKIFTVLINDCTEYVRMGACGVYVRENDEEEEEEGRRRGGVVHVWLWQRFFLSNFPSSLLLSLSFSPSPSPWTSFFPTLQIFGYVWPFCRLWRLRCTVSCFGRHFSCYRLCIVALPSFLVPSLLPSSSPSFFLLSFLSLPLS